MSEALPPRRRLLEEVGRERARTIAFLPIDAEEPPGSSLAWQFGLARWAAGAPAKLPARRARALECAAIALAWLEAVEAELEEKRDSGP